MIRSTDLLFVLACLGACGEGVDASESEAGETGYDLEPCSPGYPVGLKVGMCAPEFELPNAEGELVKLSSFRGKVALVDISALW